MSIHACKMKKKDETHRNEREGLDTRVGFACKKPS